MAFGKPKNPLLENPEQPPNEDDYLADQLEVKMIKPGGRPLCCGCYMDRIGGGRILRRCLRHHNGGEEPP